MEEESNAKEVNKLLRYVSKYYTFETNMETWHENGLTMYSIRSNYAVMDMIAKKAVNCGLPFQYNSKRNEIIVFGK